MNQAKLVCPFKEANDRLKIWVRWESYVEVLRNGGRMGKTVSQVKFVCGCRKHNGRLMGLRMGEQRWGLQEGRKEARNRALSVLARKLFDRINRPRATFRVHHDGLGSSKTHTRLKIPSTVFGVDS